MSRLIDKLTQPRQSEPRPIGFMAYRTITAKPVMQLVASVTPENLEKVVEGLKSADAVQVEVAKSGDIDVLEKICQAEGGIPGGAWLKTSNSSTLKKFLSADCDFMVFPVTTPLTVVQKDKVGKILEVDASLNEGLLRAAGDLPVDAVLASAGSDEISLTLNRLMFIQRLVYMVSKPVLTPVPASVTGPELQALWDIGVAGVVIEIEDEKSAEKLSELHKIIEKLNPPAPRKKGKSSAILPRLQAESPHQPEEGEDGEEEDE